MLEKRLRLSLSILLAFILLALVIMQIQPKPSKQAHLDCAYVEAVLSDVDGKYANAHRLLLQGASPREDDVCVVILPIREWTWGTTYYVRGKLTVREERRIWRGERTVLKPGEDF